MAGNADWERVATLFETLVALAPDERETALRRLRDDDIPLSERLAAMLTADETRDLPLDRDPVAMAGSLLEAGPMAPRVIGAYRLERMLGEGGSAVVHLAVRADLGHRVAIKFLRDAWLSPLRRERFLGEQQMLAQLSHPAIAQFHDADVLPDGTPWLAMEYVEGLPITEHCDLRGLDALDRLRLVRRVAEGVRHAHQQAVIHRDLKPSNILVTSEGDVKVVDFGIAKQLKEGGGSDDTRTGLRMLTPAYAAPEQLTSALIGTYTDVYALGVVTYQLLTGRLPFDLDGLSVSEAAAIIGHRNPAPPSASTSVTLARHLRGDVDVLLATAMHPDVHRRYRDMDAFIRDMDHLLAGEPLEARPDSLPYRAGKFARRNASAVAMVLTASAAMVALVTFYTIRLREARDTALAETARVEGVQRFTQNLFEGGDASAAPPETLRVLTLLERGVQEARSLTADPRAQGELFFTLGGIYQKLGRLERADTLMLAALDRRRTTAGMRHPLTADALVALALLRMDQARYADAERSARDAMQIHAERYPPAHSSHATDRVALGRILEAKGDYPAALTVLNEAVRLHAAHDSTSLDYVAAATALANTHFYAGNYDAADSLNRRLLALDRQRHGPRHPAVAEDLINLGAAEFERGKYKEAEAFYREALGITRGWYGETHPATAANLTMLGRALVRAERWEEAISSLEQALGIRERVFGMNHPNVASTVNEIGTVELRRKRWDEAERHYQRAAQIYRTAYDGRHYLIGIALSNLGSVRMGRTDFVGAESVLREALQRFTETLPAEHSNIAIARIKLGSALLGQRRWADVVKESTAGYDVLARQATPSMRFLQMARKDLAAAHGALGDANAAARWRADSAVMAAKRP
jgi:eukaryotic-like serine/threonine-protein kinase